MLSDILTLLRLLLKGPGNRYEPLPDMAPKPTKVFLYSLPFSSDLDAVCGRYQYMGKGKVNACVTSWSRIPSPLTHAAVTTKRNRLCLLSPNWGIYMTPSSEAHNYYKGACGRKRGLEVAEDCHKTLFLDMTGCCMHDLTGAMVACTRPVHDQAI